MNEKMKNREGGIKLLCNLVDANIIKIDGKSPGIYFYWKKCEKLDENTFLDCIVIKCESDTEVVKFCKQNDLKDIWHRTIKERLFIITSLRTRNERSLLRVIRMITENTQSEKLNTISINIEQTSQEDNGIYMKSKRLWIRKEIDGLDRKGK